MLFTVDAEINQWTRFGFKRAGAIIAAVNLDLATTRPTEITLLSGMDKATALSLYMLENC